MAMKTKTSDTPRIAHKTRVHLNNKQASWMLANCTAGRFAYNFAVEYFNNSKKWPSVGVIKKAWSATREERYPWMKKNKLTMLAINDVIQNNFARALNDYKRSGYKNRPKFHGKHSTISLAFSYASISDKHISGKTLMLPNGQGKVRLAEPIRFRHIKLMSSTFSYSGGKWYVSFLLAVESMPVIENIPADGTSTGVDFGITVLAALSNGDMYKGHPANDLSSRLKREERKLSGMTGPIKNKRRASKNWRKQQLKVSMLKRKQANIRKNYLEHVSLEIVTNNKFVGIEDLKVKNMTKSAAGDSENPGTNVAAKSGLNRELLNNGFYTLRTLLESKAARRGGTVVAVNPRNTSRKCSDCGHVDKDNRKTQAVFSCLSCGYTANADTNAAKNIEAAAIELYAAEVESNNNN